MSPSIADIGGSLFQQANGKWRGNNQKEGRWAPGGGRVGAEIFMVLKSGRGVGEAKGRQERGGWGGGGGGRGRGG
jgi:hypothetical protein